MPYQSGTNISCLYPTYTTNKIKKQQQNINNILCKPCAKLIYESEKFQLKEKNKNPSSENNKEEEEEKS